MTNQWTNEYSNEEHARQYLARAGSIPHRQEGEAVLLELLPTNPGRVLDLGTGDGRLLALVKGSYPQVQGVGLDFSPAMLQAARQRFRDDPTITIHAHNLEDPLPDLGLFDAVISSFAIHHVEDPRKAGLYREVFQRLAPGGIFCNLEHVASPTPALHAAFYAALGLTVAEEDPSNRLASVADNLAWLHQAGFANVDCLWKWRELALLTGVKPEA